MLQFFVFILYHSLFNFIFFLTALYLSDVVSRILFFTVSKYSFVLSEIEPFRTKMNASSFETIYVFNRDTFLIIGFSSGYFFSEKIKWLFTIADVPRWIGWETTDFKVLKRVDLKLTILQLLKE